MNRKLPPGLGHAALGAAFTAIIGIPFALAGLPAIIGAAFAIGFYAGRERRQTEEWAGSNRVSPLVWNPRAWRDMGWPALSAIVTAIVIELAF